jgi:hypothetical protein
MTHNDDNRFAEEHHKEPRRRRFLKRAVLTAGAAMASAGIYELVDTFAQPPQSVALAAVQLPQEQYFVVGQRIVNVNSAGVNGSNATFPVLLHPLHNTIITAKLKVPANAKSLQEAQQHLESVLTALEQKYTSTSTPLTITVAWGLPYFQNYVPSLGKSSSFFTAGTRYPNYMPIDLVTSQKEGHTVYAVQDAMTFPSDQPPAGFGPVHLEQNDIAVLLRCNSLANINDASSAIFGTGSNQAGSLFTVTSIRRGFAGGGFYGKQSLPSKMALAANIPYAKSIPTHAEAFLGFTTTMQANMGPGNIANLETIPGTTNQWPNGYFMHGTTMHISHMYEDLATWYGNGPGNFSAYPDRVRAVFRPGLSPAEGTLTFNPSVETETDVEQDVQKYYEYGHSGSMQTIVRQPTPTKSNYGNVFPTNTPVSVRGDFNTLDNPFYYTSDPAGDHYSTRKAAGVHFIIFQPTIGNFNRTRLAMDGQYPDGTKLSVPPRAHGAGFNSVLFTTHRQNYLIPSRSHRAFPLAELLG